MIAATQGIPFTAISASEVEGTSNDDNWQNILVKGDSSIRTPADLANKTIAVNALKGVGEKAMEALVEERERGGHYDRVEVAAGYNLRTLSEKYRLPQFEQHDALGDAFQAACLFVFVVKKMQSFGCRTLRDLHTVSRSNLGLF